MKKLSKGRKKLVKLITDTAKKLNLINVVRIVGIDLISKEVLKEMRDDLFGEISIDEKIETAILKYA